jgi:zinc D-Ala-D-Ala dipeptidase
MSIKYISKSKLNEKKFELIDLSGEYFINILNKKHKLNLSNIFFIDSLVYSTTNNFTGKIIYDKKMKPLIRKNLILPLLYAANEFFKNGYKIKILDAFRSESVQRKFYNLALVNGFQNYVANPDGYGPANPYSIGSSHTKGCALDITLTKKNEYDQWVEIEMPSKYDSFIPQSSPNYNGHNLTEKSISNRDLLITTIKKYGFNVHKNEWWHFDYFDSNNIEKYPLLTDIVKIISHNNLKTLVSI